ncbi:MAG: prepilin-type N-terminal cleavage/methylation domain-containing protein [Dehalococcoidales bacterium]|nr:prepilin-type N-terminal cleavage/methylation domain-containing protein [Dehalococcoidales bacterium]
MVTSYRFTKLLSKLKCLTVKCKRQNGFGLIESLIAVALFGTAALMLVSSLSTSMILVGFYEERVTAENIARTQMAYTRHPNQEYIPGANSYPALERDDDYNVTVTVAEIDPLLTEIIQKITITVYHNQKQVYILEGIKVNP